MDNCPKNALLVCRQLLVAKRQFPSGLPVRTVGYVPAKTRWVCTAKDRMK
jgi:hypothetical protein